MSGKILGLLRPRMMWYSPHFAPTAAYRHAKPRPSAAPWRLLHDHEAPSSRCSTWGADDRRQDFSGVVPPLAALGPKRKRQRVGEVFWRGGRADRESG